MSDTLTGATGRNYVAGEWRDADTGDTYEKRSPWRPSEVTGVYQASGTADVDAAVAAARDAFPPWAALPAPSRAAIFHRAADAVDARTEQIAADMTAEMGKPLREARMEAARAATILRFAAGEAWRPIGEVYAASVALQRLYTVRRPLGVVPALHPERVHGVGRVPDESREARAEYVRERRGAEREVGARLDVGPALGVRRLDPPPLPREQALVLGDGAGPHRVAVNRIGQRIGFVPRDDARLETQ